ncbi:MAG: Ppx/GppA family phosphatase [Firmicutes bacterium]|jgi:exopolyphosphatase/guanosine-5'-triphosphate,3'-diphosphate pyrophosphatase|nr:Ppx/GppA phosphatase family protein [Bacillota bacterium]NLO66461.1 Ppx/GppA family phosphatase [Bacillota bacterium]
MERIGIIDVGSNSIRLIIIDVKDNRAHHQIENLKETVRLRSGTDPQGSLTERGMEYAIETVSLFVKLCQVRKVNTIRAVATAAVRRAPNGAEFVARIEQRCGIKVEILSGDQEAYMGYLGLVNSITRTDGLMADLGGGALKLVQFADRLRQNSITLDFGAVSLMEQFNLHDRPAPEDLARLEAFLDESYAAVPWLKDQPYLIGVGGTFRSLARIYRNHVNYVPDLTDGIIIPTESVGEIYNMLKGMDLAQRRQVPGLERARADLSVTGIGIIYKLLQATGSPVLEVSASSIRDGLFFAHVYSRDPIVFNVLTHHTQNLIDYHQLDENHLRRVANLAVTLFDQLQPLHGLGSWERRLLLVAGLLHELGVVISVESLEKHTLYTVLNSALKGLNHRERVIIAYLAASHDQLFTVNLQQYVTNGPVEPGDIERLEKLAPLLQIAHSLDRSRTGAVTHVRTRLDGDLCEILVFGNQSRDLEIRDATRSADAFQDKFGVKLVVTQATGS